MKKLVAVLLALSMVFALVACGKSSSGSGFKVGVVLVGDENEGYTYAHIKGIKEACSKLGLSEDSVIWYYNVPEDETCKDKCVDLAEQGCKLVITNSYGHQSYTKEAAKLYPDVTFVAMTGDQAKVSDLPNLCNAFTRVYESRYVSGIVAGMKVKELVEAGKLTDKNYDADGKVKIGYVGAYTYAEVISGFTAFYLGARSVYPDLSMEVWYTGSWFSLTDEAAAAEKLVADGCVIIGQHADSTGAPSAIEAALNAGTTVYSVGYNIDMLKAAPNAALTSATNVWEVYYEYAIGTAMKGEKVAQNWAEGYNLGAVEITPLGPNVAPGTKEAVDAAEAALKAGTLQVFDTSTFTIDGGKTLDHFFAIDTDGDFAGDIEEVVFDGYFHESYAQSAPAFNLAVDGITQLNSAF